MNTRFINCDVCQTEGRILTNNGGPDDVDHGVCPECNGERVVEVETEPATMDDRQVFEWDHVRDYRKHEVIEAAVDLLAIGAFIGTIGIWAAIWSGQI